MILNVREVAGLPSARKRAASSWPAFRSEVKT